MQCENEPAGARTLAAAATVVAHRRFLGALGGTARCFTPDATLYRPLVLQSGPPLPGVLRVYLYNMSDPITERQAGAFRIQITLPDAGRGRGHFDWSDDAFVILAGYERQLDVFALWDAGIYDGPEGIAFSRNCQVRDSTLYAAMTRGLSEQRRRMRGGIDEDIVAATPINLVRALERRWMLSIERMLTRGYP